MHITNQIKKHIVFLIGLILNFNTWAQPSYFQSNYGNAGTSYNGGYVAQAPSGTIYLMGNFFNVLSGDHGFELYKLESNGAIVWRSQIATGEVHANRMIYTKNNHLLFNGQQDDSLGNTDAFAMLVDTNGSIIFHQTYGFTNSTEMFMGVSETSDNGFIFCGYTTNPTGPGNANYIVKTDSNLFMQWQQTYSYSVNAVSDDILETPQGDYVFSGDKKTNGPNYNAQVIKIDNTGAVIWQTDLVFPYNGGCKNLIINAAGDYVVIGEAATATSSYFDPFITKLDTAGNIIWSHTIPCSNGPDAGYDILEITPDNYLITGFGFDTSSANTDLVVMRLDGFGNEVTRRYYGGPNYDQGYNLIKSVYNNGFLAAGFSLLSPDSKLLLVYDDYLGLPLAVAELQKSTTLIYPCPVDRMLNFANENISGTVLVYNSMGQLVYENEFDSYRKTINTANFSNGIYFLEIAGSSNSHQKFIVNH